MNCGTKKNRLDNFLQQNDKHRNDTETQRERKKDGETNEHHKKYKTSFPN